MAGIDIKTLKSSLPDSLKEKGISKIRTLLLEKGQEVKNKLQPKLNELQSQLPSPNDVCLTESQTQRVLSVRNNLIIELNKIQKSLNTLTLSIGITSGFLETLIVTTGVVKNLKTTLTLSANAAPVVPGVVVGAITSADDLLSRITFDDLGNSKLNPLKQNIDAASIPIALTAASLKSFILTLNVIDAFLKKCAPNAILETVNEETLATALIQEIIETNPLYNNSLYQGFQLEIEEKDYSPTIKQRRAIGKNNQGIILISTPYSFSTDAQTLINELKLIIDRDNLKAY
jgi:hypothetical protein